MLSLNINRLKPQANYSEVGSGTMGVALGWGRVNAGWPYFNQFTVACLSSELSSVQYHEWYPCKSAMHITSHSHLQSTCYSNDLTIKCVLHS